MYTGDQYIAYNPYETENIKTRLFILNHQQDYSTESQWKPLLITEEIAIIIFSIDLLPTIPSFTMTDVYSLAINGAHVLDKQLTLNYSLQLTEDKIESTTLEAGEF